MEVQGYVRLCGPNPGMCLVVVDLDGTEVTNREIVLEGIGRVRNVKQGPDGYIYVGVDGAGIYRIMPEN